MANLAKRISKSWIVYAPLWLLDTTYRLSPKLAEGVLGFYVWLLWRCNFRRLVLEKNLKIAFPEKTPDLAPLIKEIYFNIRQIIRTILELRYTPDKELIDKITLKGVDRLLAEHQKHKRVIIVGAHYGQWLLATILPRFGFNLTIFMVKMGNPFYHRWFYKALTNHGATVVLRDKKKMISGLRQALAKNQSLLIAADLNSPGSKTIIKFFGRPARFGSSAYRLALIDKVPVFFGTAYADADGQRVLDFKPLMTDFSDIKDVASYKPTAAALAQDFVKLTEKQIRQNPAAYFGWFNRRWKEPIDHYSVDYS